MRYFYLMVDRAVNGFDRIYPALVKEFASYL